MKKIGLVISLVLFNNCGSLKQQQQQSSPEIFGTSKKVSSITLSPFSTMAKSTAATPATVVPEVAVACIRTQNHLLDLPSIYSNLKLFYPISSDSGVDNSWSNFNSQQAVKIDNSKVFIDSYSLENAKGDDNGCYVSISFLVYDLRIKMRDMTTTRDTKNLLNGASQSQEQNLKLLFSENRPVASIDVTWSFVDQKSQPAKDFFVSTADIASKASSFEVKNISFKCIDCNENKIIYTWKTVVDYQLTNSNGDTFAGSKEGLYLTGSKSGPLFYHL